MAGTCYFPIFALLVVGAHFLVPVSCYVVHNYTVQLRLVIDQSAVDKWTKTTTDTNLKDMEREIRSIFVDITDIYSSLLPHTDIDFSFEITNVTFLDLDLFAHLTQGQKAIADFHKWIAPSYKTQHYDVAMLLTGVPMTGGIGFGYIGKICQEKSVAVVPFTATFKDAIVWAHEIGHVCGAEHDYELEPEDACYKASGKIMSPIVRNSPEANNYVFSPCSASYIRYTLEQLTKKGENCLIDGDKHVFAPKFGTFITPDEMCKRVFGRESFADSRPYKNNPEDICLKLHCQAKQSWQYLYHNDYTWSPQGMRCGQNKACVKGKCVEDPNGSPFVSDECPLGDHQKTGYEKYWVEVCGTIDIRDCKYYGQDCCLTCNTTNPIYSMNADEVCAVRHGPGSVLERGLYSNYGDDLCREVKCMKGKKPRFEYTTFDAPDGMACGKDKRCYKQKCVKNRHGPTGIEDDTCPFGDQDLKALGYMGSCSEQSCLVWNKWCCKSCE